MDSPYTNQLYSAIAKMLDEKDLIIVTLNEILTARNQLIAELEKQLEECINAKEELEGEVLFMKEEESVDSDYYSLPSALMEY